MTRKMWKTMDIFFNRIEIEPEMTKTITALMFTGSSVAQVLNISCASIQPE